jgi:hypothetical protein
VVNVLVVTVALDDMNSEEAVIGRIGVRIVFCQFKLKGCDRLVFPYTEATLL